MAQPRCDHYKGAADVSDSSFTFSFIFLLRLFYLGFSYAYFVLGQKFHALYQVKQQ
jgi:hypothetical protein